MEGGRPDALKSAHLTWSPGIGPLTCESGHDPPEVDMVFRPAHSAIGEEVFRPKARAGRPRIDRPGLPERTSCRVVGMNRSTYRLAKTRHPSNRDVRRILLSETVEDLHLSSRSTYGRPTDASCPVPRTGRHRQSQAGSGSWGPNGARYPIPPSNARRAGARPGRCPSGRRPGDRSSALPPRPCAARRCRGCHRCRP